jgi:hypothetical protein
VVDQVVVEAAQHGRVGQIGGAAAAEELDVVDVAPGRWLVAVREDAALVAQDHGPAGWTGPGALRPAQVKDLTGAVHDRGQDLRITGQSPNRRRGQTEPGVEHPGGCLLAERVKVDRDRDLRPVRAGARLLVGGQGLLADLDERIGTALWSRAFIDVHAVPAGPLPGEWFDRRGERRGHLRRQIAAEPEPVIATIGHQRDPTADPSTLLGSA